jgi:thiol-disulfide isomerase/thioredoxin
MISGVILSFALFLLGGHFFFLAMPENAEQMESTLFPPQFPEQSRLSIQGKTDYRCTLKTLDNKEIKLSDFRNKVLFINFWATWCIPCIAEMNSLQKLYESFKDEDVQFFLISNEDGKTVQEFLGKKQFTFPVCILGSESVPQVFKTEGVPATFIVNREGGIVFKHIGAAKWDDESCVNFIKNLL